MIAPRPPATGDPGRRIVVAGFLLILVAGLALAAWGWGQSEEQVTIRELWLRPEAHDGKRVAVQGTLRVFLAGTPQQHYAVEDARRHRVGVRGVAQTRLDQLIGRPVSVEGMLHITPDRGILIDVASIGETTR